MKRKALSLIIILLVFSWFDLVDAREQFTGRVVAISDGDTIQVMHHGKREKIRLSDIDCPEKGQAFGTKAKQFTAGLVGGQIVTVEVRTTDRYGRTVGNVFLPDGRSLNRELVREGYAWWYRKYSNDASIGTLESEARQAKRGLWVAPHAIPPWVYRNSKKGNRSQPSRSLLSVATSAHASDSSFHGNTSSSVFHGSWCKYYDCKNCGAVFRTRQEALKAGFLPCKMCNP